MLKNVMYDMLQVEGAKPKRKKRKKLINFRFPGV